MSAVPKFARWLVTLLSIACFAACTLPPPKPPQKKPISAQAQKRAAPSGSVSSDGAGAPGTGQGYGPASANAAEVQEEEVAADGSTRLISSSRRAATPAGTGGQAAGGGSGGAPISPPGSAANVGGSNRPLQPAGMPPPALEGAHFDMPEDALRPAGDTLNAAPAGGVRDGRNDAAPGGRQGVRGGRDESGAMRDAAPDPASPKTAPRAPAQYENDVLAQQLREAAERETDPVLRQKLWIEYQNYKAGL